MRIAILIVLFFISFQCRCFAQAGSLDTGFSGDGLLVWDLSAFEDRIQAVVVQPDGKILGAGWITDGTTATIMLQRLLPDGSPDPSFGSGGVVYTSAVDGVHYAYSVGVQSTGHVVVAGLSYDLSFDANVVLVRYMPNGSPDGSFGTGGLLLTDLGGGPGFQAAYAMRIMNDDRIVITGQDDENGMTCARFSPAGVPDATYGSNGVAITGVIASTGLCMDLLPDGSVVAGGYALPVGYPDWMLARFDPNGTLDPGFGIGGIATFDIGSDNESMKGVSVLSDGRIAACGYRGFNGQDDEPAVALFNSDGSPDLNFGVNGVLVFPFTAPQWGQATAIIAGPDDKLLLAGFRVQPGGVANNDFFLCRLLDDGMFDGTFAGGAQVFTDVSGSFDRAHAMALTPVGSVVLAGQGQVTESSTAYAVYHNDLSLAVPTTGSSSIALSLHPVPASDHVVLAFGANATGPITVELRSTDGRSVSTTVIMLEAGGRAPRLELPSDLPVGSYVISANGEFGRINAPLIISATAR